MYHQQQNKEFSHRNNGFTLIELMVVVAIVAILVTIAIPSYRQYMIKESRIDAETAMTQIAQKLEAYKLVNNSYSSATLANIAIYGSNQFVESGTALYTFNLDTSVAGSWKLTATPIGRQAGDGIIMLNDQGQHCWVSKSPSCSLSSTSVWSN